MVKEISDTSFEQEVLKETMPVLVDFWAPWCGPCHAVSPVVEDLSREYIGKLKVCKLNVDQSRQIASKYSIMSIPTLMFFKEGVPFDNIVGAVPKSVLKEKIDELI